MRTLIQNGTLVTPEHKLAANLLLEGEKIAAILSSSEPVQTDRVLDATGLLVLPGIIDAHTHIQLDTGLFKTADNWEIGTRAAAVGGVTTAIDFANQIRSKSFAEALDVRKAESSPSLIDYSYHFVMLDPDQDDKALAVALADLLEQGISSLKLFTTYRPNYYLEDASILRIFRAMPEGMVAMIHCENDSIVSNATASLEKAGTTGWQYHPQSRPAAAEVEAISRMISLAELSGSNPTLYIAHCSTAASLDLIESRRNLSEVSIFCETCPQYLLLDHTGYAGDHPERYILQPPLRSEADMRGLREYILSGSVDVLSTDTCDYTLKQKLASPKFTETPGGLPGIETLLPLMVTLFCHQGGMDITELLPLMTARPAQLFGMYPQKGVLQVGSDADIVLFDPEAEWHISHESLHYLAGYSPYEGHSVLGQVRATLSRGEMLYQAGEFTASAGRGRFVSCKPAGF
jgi:dihydropyrimidinase